MPQSNTSSVDERIEEILYILGKPVKHNPGYLTKEIDP